MDHIWSMLTVFYKFDNDAITVAMHDTYRWKANEKCYPSMYLVFSNIHYLKS